MPSESKARRPACIAAPGFAFLLLIGVLNGAAARSAAGTLTIDYHSLPTIAVDATKVPAIIILERLSKRLHFKVENAPSPENSPTVTASFKGNLADLLQTRLLCDTNYVILYSKGSIERIVIAPANGAAQKAAAASASTDAEKAAPTAAAADAPSPIAANAEQPESALMKLLETQASETQQANPTTTTNSGDPTMSSTAPSGSVSDPKLSAAGTTQAALAAMTQSAKRNVEMLAGALNTICLGENCRQ